MANLRTLPLFGKQIAANEINFKFPSIDLFEHINGMEMDLMEVRLSSVFIRSSFPEFKRIDGIKLKFTSGIISPEFSTDQGKIRN